MKRVYALVLGIALGLAALVAPAAASAAPVVSRDQAVNLVIARGLAQRGVPYVWGGGDINGPTAGKPESAPPSATPSVAPGLAAGAIPGLTPGAVPSADPVAAPGVVGFDASGLIQYVYAGVNAKLPRSSGAMYNVGQKVTPAQALPADLIFYGPDGSQSVAMFLGNNQMLEVGDKGVQVSPVRTTDMAPYLVRIIAGGN